MFIRAHTGECEKPTPGPGVIIVARAPTRNEERKNVAWRGAFIVLLHLLGPKCVSFSCDVAFVFILPVFVATAAVAATTIITVAMANVRWRKLKRSFVSFIAFKDFLVAAVVPSSPLRVIQTIWCATTRYCRRHSCAIVVCECRVRPSTRAINLLFSLHKLCGGTICSVPSRTASTSQFAPSAICLPIHSMNISVACHLLVMRHRSRRRCIHLIRNEKSKRRKQIRNKHRASAIEMITKPHVCSFNMILCIDWWLLVLWCEWRANTHTPCVKLHHNFDAFPFVCIRALGMIAALWAQRLSSNLMQFSLLFAASCMLWNCYNSPFRCNALAKPNCTTAQHGETGIKREN